MHELEVVGLWCLLTCALKCGIRHLQVLGDSQVVINWISGEASVSSLELHHWFFNTRRLMNDFTFLSFNHIFRKLNIEADALSKREIGAMDSRLCVLLLSVGLCSRSGYLDLFT